MRKERSINIRLVITDELPESVKGCGGEFDGSYIVALNSRINEKLQLLTFLHEVLHIWHEDFKSKRPVQEIEADRHRELSVLLNMMQRKTTKG